MPVKIHHPPSVPRPRRQRRRAGRGSRGDAAPRRKPRGDAGSAIRSVVGEAVVKNGKVQTRRSAAGRERQYRADDGRRREPDDRRRSRQSIHVFNEKNPQPNIGNYYLGPRAGRAQISTRIRLADSQKVVAIARLSDGSFWSATADVVVTLAACTDEVI